jgi:MYXO-CTERM domain-containing protein
MSGDDGDDEDSGCSIADGAPRSTGSGVAALALLGLAATLRRRRSAR